MGFWRPINPLLIFMGLSVCYQYRYAEEHPSDWNGLLVCGLVGLLLSLGPSITESIPNPVISGPDYCRECGDLQNQKSFSHMRL